MQRLVGSNFKTIIMKKVMFSLAMAVAATSTTLAAPIEKPEMVWVKPMPTPLCNAISKGDFEAVKKFVEYGADVNERSNGLTPLMVAARYNRVDMVEFLLAKGAQLDAKSDNGFTAKRYAELSKATEAANFLGSYRKNS